MGIVPPNVLATIHWMDPPIANPFLSCLDWLSRMSHLVVHIQEHLGVVSRTTGPFKGVPPKDDGPLLGRDTDIVFMEPCFTTRLWFLQVQQTRTKPTTDRDFVKVILMVRVYLKLLSWTIPDDLQRLHVTGGNTAYS